MEDARAALRYVDVEARRHDRAVRNSGGGATSGTGRHRLQISYFFRMQIGSRTPSRIGLGSGSRLRRMRKCLGLSRELWIQNFGDLGSGPMSG